MKAEIRIPPETPSYITSLVSSDIRGRGPTMPIIGEDHRLEKLQFDDQPSVVADHQIINHNQKLYRFNPILLDASAV